MFENKLKVGPAPHLRTSDSIPKIMWSVNLALLPALVAGIMYFGWYAGLIVLISVLFAIITELVCQKMRRLPLSISDGSAVVTGILLGFILPPNIPLYIPALGAAFAIGIAKHAFGGLGCNIWNPALAARAFLLAAYSSFIVMPKWPVLDIFFKGHITATDAITKATPLAVLKANPMQFFNEYSLGQLFTGNRPGCIGETSVIALLLGALFLIFKKYINWRLPVAFVLTVGIAVILLPLSTKEGLMGFWQASFWAEPGLVLDRAVAHMVSGGLILGAFFMATDMVTSPLTSKGQVFFGIGCGLLVAIIRYYGGYPEGVCYAILLMNTAVWVFDKYTKPKFFGELAKNEK